MRARSLSFLLSFGLALAFTGCTKPPANTNSSANANSPTSTNPNDNGAAAANQPAANNQQPSQAAQSEPPPAPKPLVVAAGRSITISLGSPLGSKISQAGSTFSGSVAKDIMVGDAVAIPRGSSVSGTVVDAKALGRFKGGALLQVRLDSVNLNGADVPIRTATRTYTEKGKGKRTAELAGGGAVLGGIIGALAGGGKGAAIGLAAGGGAGAGGAALTGNKEIVLPAESAVSFELTRPLEIQQ
jgi:hypothetical protein